jgi:hypothetical protein
MHLPEAKNVHLMSRPSDTRNFVQLFRESETLETVWRREVNSNCRYRFLNCQTVALIAQRLQYSQALLRLNSGSRWKGWRRCPVMFPTCNVGLKGVNPFLSPDMSIEGRGDRTLLSGPRSRAVALILYPCLPRPCGRAIAFTETFSASAITPLDETWSKVFAAAIATGQPV